MTVTTTTLQLGCKFNILAMALMVTMTLLLTSTAFTFQSMPSFMTRHLHSSRKKPLQGGTTTTIASSTKRLTQQLLMSSRKGSAHYDRSWRQRYLELKEFYQKFGHTKVPQKYSDNPQLGRWVDNQRTSYKEGKLTAEQIQDLVDIGYQWDSQNAAWEQRYLELKEYHHKFGHTDVPRRYADNPQLGLWVMTQRARYKKGKLTAERIQDLVDIGFHFDSRNAAWKQRYLELKEYHQKFGHTDIPARYPDNPQLGLWVATQRRSYKKGKLAEEQIRALVDIDFKWEAPRGRRTKV